MPIRIVVILIILAILWMFNRQFITPLLLGLITATLSYPLFKVLDSRVAKIKFLQNAGSKLSAIFCILLISVVLFLGFDFLGHQVAKEAPGFVTGITNFARGITKNQPLVGNLEKFGVSKENVQVLSDKLNSQIDRLIVPAGTKRSISADQIESQLTKVFNFSGGLFKYVFDYLVYFVIFLLAWFNSLTSGKEWLKAIFGVLPFNTEEEEDIQHDLKTGVNNVVYANVLGGFIHAAICFVIMLIFGVPNLFILTILIFLIGVLPLSPSELAYALPLLIILQTNPFAVLILAVFAELVILFVNYVLMPKIINNGQSGNPLLIITSILAGISIFGIMGFIIGPMIMIFVQTLYGILMKRSKE